MEQVGCIHFDCEPRTYDFPGSESCDLDLDTEQGWLESCGPDCPGFNMALDEATARNI